MHDLSATNVRTLVRHTLPLFSMTDRKPKRITKAKRGKKQEKREDIQKIGNEQRNEKFIPFVCFFIQQRFNTQRDTAYESIVELDDHEGGQ